MSSNTLETAYANGEVIDASHVNELTLALLSELVGRNTSGIPSSGQSLGTLALPWGNLYATGIILDGLALDTTQITSLPNRIVSGQTRALSSMPDFLRAAGASLAFDIEGAATDLVLSINNTATTISSDINKTGITGAPSTNNTADINDTTISNDLYAGESDAAIKEITIDAVGSEISTRVGQIAAFLTPTGEIFQGLVKNATTIVDVYRGYYFDSSGNPLGRGNLSNNDTITFLNIGWVFVEDNGTTVDVSYTTPTISYNAPGSPSAGDYWFDISNQVWKRYSGTTFEIINRILIGQVVSDDTATIATRSIDFSNQYRELNNAVLDVDSSEIIKAVGQSSRCSVYGTEIQIDLTKLNWNITVDLETGTEAADTDYYLYLSDQGQEVISTIKPYFRADLKGHYHPFHSWRCLGRTYNDSSSDFVYASSYMFNSNKEVGEDSVWVRSGNGFGSTATKIRRYNIIYEDVSKSMRYSDSATDGALFEILEDGLFTISVNDYRAGNGYFGASANATNLTASVAVTDEALCIDSSSGFLNNATWTGYLKKGDLIRPHTDGVATDVASGIYNAFFIARVG